MQSKRWSLYETCISTVIGLVVSLIANHYVLPLYGFNPSLSQNMSLTAIFTVISVIRSYFVRRGFNWIHVKFHTKRTA